MDKKLNTLSGKKKSGVKVTNFLDQNFPRLNFSPTFEFPVQKFSPIFVNLKLSLSFDFISFPTSAGSFQPIFIDS